MNESTLLPVLSSPVTLAEATGVTFVFYPIIEMFDVVVLFFNIDEGLNLITETWHLLRLVLVQVEHKLNLNHASLSKHNSKLCICTKHSFMKLLVRKKCTRIFTDNEVTTRDWLV